MEHHHTNSRPLRGDKEATVDQPMDRRVALLTAIFLWCSVSAQTPNTAAPSNNSPLPPLRPTVQERLGYPATARLLIIHADDLGMSHSVNRATFEALEKGWITSASILVPCPWFPEVVRFAKSHPNMDLGIHLALNSEWTDYRWTPITAKERVPSLLDDQGYMPADESIVAKQAKPAEVSLELQAQVDRALKAGIHLSHLDTHMTALVGSLDLFHVYQSAGRKYHLPVLVGDYNLPAETELDTSERLVQRVIGINPGIASKDWAEWYMKALAALPPGVYELIVHLGYDDDEMRGATWDHSDWGAVWRQSDFDMVRSPEFHRFLADQGFILASWRDLAKAAK
jgi:chitin disaccharide deacetylase